MSHFDYLRDARSAIALLRRLDAGDEAAYKEIEPLIKRIDERDGKRRVTEEAKQAARVKRSTSGRKNSGAFEIAPASEAGVDYGATGLILLRKGPVRLVWRSGSKYFSGIGRQAYAPADLDIMTPPVGKHGRWVCEDLTKHHKSKLEGERVGIVRLTKALVLSHRQRIDEVFGPGAAERAAELKQTVIL